MKRTVAINLEDLQVSHDNYASLVVDRILNAAISIRASDVHLDPNPDGIAIRLRQNGRLLDGGRVVDGSESSILSRIKALSSLITYRSDIPQEGRMTIEAKRPDSNQKRKIEIRVGTIPTLHGERAVLRLSVASSVSMLPDELGFSDETLQDFNSVLNSPSGVLLITGPAGSGKTTSAYAAVRKIASDEQLRSIVTLEDPVECEIEGTAQSQINSEGEYDWQSGLRALLRQDPEVMMVGEIRDSATASVAFQAATTGQLVITTMHAKSCADALRRLIDLQVPVQHLTSGLSLLLCQRLYPELCGGCKSERAQVVEQNQPCSACEGSGIVGRRLVAEAIKGVEGQLASAVLGGADADELARVAESNGMTPIGQQVAKLVEQGLIETPYGTTNSGVNQTP